MIDVLLENGRVKTQRAGKNAKGRQKLRSEGSQGMSRIADHRHKLGGRHGPDSPSEKEPMLLTALISDLLQNCEG